MALIQFARSVVWLMLVQALNYLVPLATIPVVARALAPSTFGEYSSILAIATFTGALMTYGVFHSGPREVARLRDNIEALSKHVSATLETQFLLALVTIPIYATAVAFYPDQLGTIAIIAVFLQSAAWSGNPMWVLQGLGCMQRIFWIYAATRITAAILTIMLVRSPGDVVVLAVINAASGIVALLAALQSLQKLGLKWQKISASDRFRLLREDADLFFSLIAARSQKNMTVLIVGALLGPVAAGAYALAERIGQALLSFAAPIDQALYPLMSRLSLVPASSEDIKVKRFGLTTMIVFSGFISVVGYFGAPVAVRIFGGERYKDAVTVLEILSILPLLASMSNICGVQTMMTNGMQREYAKIMIVSSLFGVMLIASLTYSLGLAGAGLGVVLAELMSLILMTTALRRRKLFSFLLS